MVRPTRTRPLLLAAAVVTLACWLLLHWWTSGGHELPALPWSAPGVLVLLIVVIAVFGWPVRRWTRGHRDVPLDPLRAARTVVLAKAAQYCGAILGGWYAAQLLVLLPTLDVEPRRAMFFRAAASLVAAVALWVVGWLVERWCRVDRSDEDQLQRPDR